MLEKMYRGFRYRDPVGAHIGEAVECSDLIDGTSAVEEERMPLESGLSLCRNRQVVAAMNSYIENIPKVVELMKDKFFKRCAHHRGCMVEIDLPSHVLAWSSFHS